MPTSYVYSQSTGEQTGTSTYYVDGYGDDIISASQTKDVPPSVGANECARYLDENGDVPSHHGVNNAAWVTHDDYRNTVHYDPDGTLNTITDLNVTVPVGNITDAPTSGYHETHNGTTWNYTGNTQHTEDRCDEVDALLLTKFELNFTHNTYDWQVDDAGRKAILERATYAVWNEADATTFPWTGDYTTFTDADNTARTFTTGEYKTFTKAVIDHCEGLKQSALTHKAALRSGTYTTHTAVEDYDITTSW